MRSTCNQTSLDTLLRDPARWVGKLVVHLDVFRDSTRNGFLRRWRQPVYTACGRWGRNGVSQSSRWSCVDRRLLSPLLCSGGSVSNLLKPPVNARAVLFYLSRYVEGNNSMLRADTLALQSKVTRREIMWSYRSGKALGDASELLVWGSKSPGAVRQCPTFEGISHWGPRVN